MLLPDPRFKRIREGGAKSPAAKIYSSRLLSESLGQEGVQKKIRLMITERKKRKKARGKNIK